MAIFSKSNHHELSINNVERTFINLLRQHGQTSSLEVKNVLRDMGYCVKQEELSSMMRRIANNHGLEYTYNGTHRVYVDNQSVIYNDNFNNRSKLTFQIIRQQNRPIPSWNSGKFRAV